MDKENAKIEEMKFEYVDDPKNGPLDGVRSKVQAVRTNMRTGKQMKINVSVTGSCEIGVLSILDIEKNKMISVSLDDITEMLYEVFERSKFITQGEVK